MAVKQEFKLRFPHGYHCSVLVTRSVFQFEGLPTYPDVGRMWEVVDKYQVTKFYTAPTAIRTLMKYGSEPVQK